MRVRLVLEAVPRLVALLVLWESIELLVSHGTHWLLNIEVVASSVTALLTNLFTLAASITAVITVVTASPLLYAASLVLLALAKSSIGVLISTQSIVGLAVILVVDHIKGVYREKQSTSIRYPGRALIAALASLSILYTGIALLCVSIASYVQQLISALIGLSLGMAGKSPILAIFLGNPLIQLAIAGFMIKAFYTILTNAFDTLALYAYPSRRVSLSVLTSRDDIDLRIDTPLQTLQHIIVASCLAPPLYAVLYRILIPAISSYVPSIGALQSLAARIAVALAIFVITSLAVRTISQGFLFGNVKRVLVVSLALLITVYGASAFISFQRAGDLVYALLNPDVDTLTRLTARIYANYYIQFFYLVDLLLKLVGAAP